MITQRLIDFVEALRRANIPISIRESIDATEVLEHCNLLARDEVKASLSAALIKDRGHQATFEELFDVYFSPDGKKPEQESIDSLSEDWPDLFSQIGDDELTKLFKDAVIDLDDTLLQSVIASAVSRFAGIEPGRPVAGVYYAYRTLHQLSIDSLRSDLFDLMISASDSGDNIAKVLIKRDIDGLINRIRDLVDAEIKRRLVSDRGPNALARTLHSSLPEDVEFMHASIDEIQEITRAVDPLVRKLATRLERKRKHKRRGALDYRKTIRLSIANGGVPAELKFYAPHIAKPELVVVADISGSVASFARFTLMLLYAIANQFSKLRSFVFIDEIDEITEVIESSEDINAALRQVNSKAKVVWVDGHSDYGRVLQSFVDRYGDQLGSRTTVMFLGDARNNYHQPLADEMGKIREKVKAIHWLNPEPVAYWNTGDSIIGEYAEFCDSVNECRNLTQLRHFVETLV